jgi:hypothetical protein
MESDTQPSTAQFTPIVDVGEYIRRLHEKGHLMGIYHDLERVMLHEKVSNLTYSIASPIMLHFIKSPIDVIFANIINYL